MIDDSGISLSASDPNASLDQSEDGGSSTDYSAIVNSVGQWGTEIASLVTRTPVAYATSPNGTLMPIGAPGSSVSVPMSSTTKLLLAAIVVAGMVIAVRAMQ